MSEIENFVYDKPQPIQIDIEKVKQQTSVNFDFIVKNYPGVYPAATRVRQLAESDTPENNIFEVIWQRKESLLEIDDDDFSIYPETDDFYLKERQNDIERCSSVIKEKTGIETDSIEIIELLSQLRREYAGLFQVIRYYEITRSLISREMNELPWPKGEVLIAFKGSGNNASHILGPNGEHIIRLENHYDYLTVSEEVRKGFADPIASVDEIYSDKIVALCHEVGHAVLADQFPADEIDGPINTTSKTNGHVNLYRALGEGIAIKYESLMRKLLYRLYPNWGDDNPNMADPVFSKEDERQRYFERAKTSATARVYPDGIVLVDNLVNFLGGDDTDEVAKIKLIFDFVKQIDVSKLTSITPEDTLYQEIVSDPRNLLNFKKEKTQEI